MGGKAPDDGRKTGAADRPPPELRYLKTLVTTLTVVMIAGLLTMIALFVTRLPGREALPPPTLPEAITLPDGARPEAFTRGRGWLGVVTDDGRLLIYDAVTGALRQTVRVETRP
jgi:hypothetical protein